MVQELTEASFIYVSGPYSARLDTPPHLRAGAVEANVERANEVALQLATLGFVPFVPHTMLRGWEDTGRVARETAMSICLAWVERCDVVFVIGQSPGAAEEISHARRCGIPVVERLQDLPTKAAPFSVARSAA